jgi:hypothetical protein
MGTRSWVENHEVHGMVVTVRDGEVACEGFFYGP